MELILYVADDVQTLRNEKSVLYGAYTDRVIILNVDKDAGVRPSKDRPALMPTLSLLLTIIQAAPGEHKFKAVLRTPSGEPIGKEAAGTIDISEYGTANAVLRYQPFLAPEMGTYKVVVSVGNEQLEASFDLRLREVAKEVLLQL